MSEGQPPPVDRTTIAGSALSIMQKLDPNMLAVLLLVVGMNGLFFWIYAELAKMRHVEFIAALNSCPASPGVGTGGAPLPRFQPGGMDR